MKYPIVIPYVSSNHGNELKHALRSFKNITNFNGEVYIVGDGELWFKDIVRIPFARIEGEPYLDQVMKMRTACYSMPEKFIASMDDVYVTSPTEIGVYAKESFSGKPKNSYQRSLIRTNNLLHSVFDIDNFVSYECHAPMLVDTLPLTEVLDFIIATKQGDLQWRSMYGNIFEVRAEKFEDKKTRTNKLPKGNIISTHFYTDELAKLFPEPSRYEDIL